MTEVWKRISGFSLYEVSNLGRVRSFQGSTPVIMKGGPTKCKMKYTRYTLVSDNGKKRCRNGHRLVLETFAPRTDTDGTFVLHKDGDPTNNRLENLYWGDYEQNVVDKLIHGWSAKGELNPNLKLSEVDVNDIRQFYRRSFTQVEIASMFAVSQAHVSRIVRNASWKAEGSICHD